MKLCQIIEPGDQQNLNCCIAYQCHRWKHMSMALVHFGCILWLMMQLAIELPVWISICFCKLSSSNKICLIHTTSHTLMYKAPILASAAKDTTALITCVMLSMALFLGRTWHHWRDKNAPQHGYLHFIHLNDLHHCAQWTPCHLPFMSMQHLHAWYNSQEIAWPWPLLHRLACCAIITPNVVSIVLSIAIPF